MMGNKQITPRKIISPSTNKIVYLDSAKSMPKVKNITREHLKIKMTIF